MRHGLVALILLALTAASVLLMIGSTEAGLPWSGDLAMSLKRASDKGRTTIVYLYTDSCGFCKKMETTTFRATEVIEDMADDYIWVRLNAETDEAGIAVREKFGVEAYPTLLLLDGDGREIDRMQGYYPASRFNTTLAELVSSPDSYGRLQRRAEAAPESAPERFDLGERLLERGDFRSAAEEFRQVLRIDPLNDSGRTPQSLYYLGFALASLNQASAALAQLESLDHRFPDSPVLPEAVILQGQIHSYGGNNREARRIFEGFLQRFPEHRSTAWVTQLIREIDSALDFAELSH